MNQKLFNKKTIIGAIIVGVLFFCLCIFIVINELNKTSTTSDTSVRDPLLSSPLPLVSIPVSYSLDNLKKINNYTSGGSTSYCPTKGDVCSKIHSYYRNINLKHFEEAYNYGQKIRDYESLVTTYANTTFIDASYVVEHQDNNFTAYVTYVDETNNVSLFAVDIQANNEFILSSTVISSANTFGIDCGYINYADENVCVFTIENTIANLYADQFFYVPEFKQSSKDSSIYYSRGGDGLVGWAIIYKYNSNDKSLIFIGNYIYTGYEDGNVICTGDASVDLDVNGCASKALTAEEVSNDKLFLKMTSLYEIK